MFNELIKESNTNEKKYSNYKLLNGEIDILENTIKKTDLQIFI